VSTEKVPSPSGELQCLSVPRRHACAAVESSARVATLAKVVISFGITAVTIEQFIHLTRRCSYFGFRAALPAGAPQGVTPGRLA
jgi:hypothetical protein